MVTLMTVLVTLIVPLILLTTLLRGADRLRRARELRAVHQVAVTDAIHAELGAVVAPVVTRRLGRGWRVEVAVPFEQPTTVERVVAIAHAAMLRAGARDSGFEIALTAQEPAVREDNLAWLHRAETRPRSSAGEWKAVGWTGTTTSRVGW